MVFSFFLASVQAENQRKRSVFLEFCPFFFFVFLFSLRHKRPPTLKIFPSMWYTASCKDAHIRINVRTTRAFRSTLLLFSYQPLLAERLLSSHSKKESPRPEQDQADREYHEIVTCRQSFFRLHTSIWSGIFVTLTLEITRRKNMTSLQSKKEQGGGGGETSFDDMSTYSRINYRFARLVFISIGIGLHSIWIHCFSRVRARKRERARKRLVMPLSA